MQLSLDIIDAFRSQAHYIAVVLINAPLHQDNFASDMLMGEVKYELTDDALVCKFADLEGNSPASVSFSGIGPSKILSLEVEPPIKIREKDEHVQLNTWNNGGSREQHYTEHFTESETITESLDIAAEIEASIKGKISAEYAGIKGELETQLRSKLSVDHTQTTQHTITNEDTLEIIVPPKTSLSLTQKQSISDFKQKIIVECLLGAHIKVDAGTWYKEFQSADEMILYLSGGGGGTGNAPELDAFANTRAYSGKLDLPQSAFRIEQNRVYQNVKTSETTTTEVEIQ